MSVVNLCIEPGRVRVLTDTVTYNGTEPVALGLGKAHDMGGWLLALRGLVYAGVWVRRFLATCPTSAEADDRLSTLHPSLIERLKSMEATLVDPDGTVIRHVFEEGKPGRRFVMRPGVFLSPYQGDSSQPIPHRTTVTDAEMVKLALVQQKFARDRGLSLCIGGCMILYTVSADGITSRIAGVYGDYWEHRAEFSCPLAATADALFPERAAA